MEELPLLDQVYATYNPQGLVMIGFSHEPWTVMIKEVRKHKWLFLQDLSDVVFGYYMQTGNVPLTYVIRKDGTIDCWDDGYSDIPKIKASIEKCLKLGVEVQRPVAIMAKTGPVQLVQKQPNQVTFTLSKSDFIRIEVYNGQGRSVRTLVNDKKSAGSHTVDVSDLENGIYFCKLVAPGAAAICRLAVAK